MKLWGKTSLEQEYWHNIKDSQDHADYFEYLKKYGGTSQYSGLAWNSIKRLVPDRFINGVYFDNIDGTVIDYSTRLQWLRFVLGQTWEQNASYGEHHFFDFEAAAKAAKNFNRSGGYAGYSDWRLPTINELKTLVVNKPYHCPTIDEVAFPRTPCAWHWSASFASYVKGNGWMIDFGTGETLDLGCHKFCAVRLVRGNMLE